MGEAFLGALLFESQGGSQGQEREQQKNQGQGAGLGTMGGTSDRLFDLAIGLGLAKGGVAH